MESAPTIEPIPPGEYVPTADRRVVLSGLKWADLQVLAKLQGNCKPRIAYLDGVVELMTVSRGHERIKSKLGSLVEQYCLDRDILLSPYGSWWLEDESEEAGAMPDECYVFSGDPMSKDSPDLVIEVVWTSGGIDKLEIYRRLEISEVWFWKRDVLSVYVLGPNGYTPAPRSVCLPELDLALLCKLAEIEPLNEAVKQLREALRS